MVEAVRLLTLSCTQEKPVYVEGMHANGVHASFRSSASTLTSTQTPMCRYPSLTCSRGIAMC